MYESSNHSAKLHGRGTVCGILAGHRIGRRNFWVVPRRMLMAMRQGYFVSYNCRYTKNLTAETPNITVGQKGVADLCNVGKRLSGGVGISSQANTRSYYEVKVGDSGCDGYARTPEYSG